MLGEWCGELWEASESCGVGFAMEKAALCGVEKMDVWGGFLVDFWVDSGSRKRTRKKENSGLLGVKKIWSFLGWNLGFVLLLSLVCWSR